jgi:tight adherence protein B
MNAPEMAALVAGMGLLLMTFGVFQIASSMLLENRLRIFVRRRGVVVQPTSVRLQRKESSVALVEQINRKLRQADYSKRIQQQLTQAGVDLHASRFIVIQAIAAAAAFLVVWFAAGMVPDLKGIGSLIVAVPVAFIAWWVPIITLSFLKSQRLGKLEKQLPTTIDAMAGALQAGSSLPQAMEMASREVPAPIGLEFGIAVREMAVGVPMQEAFASMLTRAPSLDLDMLVSAITIQHRIGGNLSSILRTISHTIRERLRIKGEIAILTAQQRMSGYVVSALPVLIIGVLFVIAPQYISKLFLPGVARFMLIAGIIGMAAGAYALKKISEIEV